MVNLFTPAAERHSAEDLSGQSRSFMPIFNIRPTVGTFLQEAYTFGILESPVIPASLLNYHIQLAFPLGIDKNHRLHFDFYPAFSMAGYAAIGALKMKGWATSLPKNLCAGDLAEAALKMLKSGGYVLLYVDYFYIKNTPHYATKHFRHDFLLFDYHAGRREFKGALYTGNKTFGPGTVPFDGLFEAFTSPYARGNECYGYCKGDLFAAFKAGSRRSRACKLDLADIRTQLTSYLDSSDLADHQLNNSLITQLCQLSGKTNLKVVFGINIYDQIWSYVERTFRRGNSWLALRVTRLLWEHKKLMTARLLSIAEEGISFRSTLFREWDEIEQTAYMVHLRAIAGREQNDLGLISSLSSDFARLKLMEQHCVMHIIERLDDAS